MKEYHKIHTLYKRDESGRIIFGDYALPEFQYLENNIWRWTEKIDGTNIRIIWGGEEIRYGGKTDNAQIPTKLLGHLQSTIHRELLLETFGTEGNVCLYGEGYGAGIQKGGGNYSAGQQFILFDVKIGTWWLERGNVIDIANKLGLDVVTEIGEYTIPLAAELVQNNVIRSTMFPHSSVEGIVGTPKTPLYTRKGERIITKIKHRDFERLADLIALAEQNFGPTILHGDV